MTREIDIAELRAKYPNPIKTPTDGLPSPADTYCVGGALALECGFTARWGARYVASGTASFDGRSASRGETLADIPDGQEVCGGLVGQRIGMFPSPDTLAVVLRQATWGLGETTALEFARRITKANDAGNFETAWATLADALGYGKEGWTPADDESVAAFLREAHV